MSSPVTPVQSFDSTANPYRVDEPLGGATDAPVEEVIPAVDPPPTEEIAPETAEITPETPEIKEEPTEKGGKHYSRSELQGKLDERLKELETLREEGSMRSQQYTDALAKQAELEKAIKERDENFVQSRTPVYDWRKDPEVAKPRQEISELVTDSAAEMTPENAVLFRKDLHLILGAYGDARSMGDVALRTFRDNLTEKLGEDGPKIFQAARAIFPRYRAASEAEEKNSINHFDTSREQHEKRRRAATEDFARIGRWTKEQIEANPDDPDAIISAAIGGDEEVLKNLEALAHKAAQASVGLPPLPPKASPELVAQHRAAERNREQFLGTAHRRDVQVRALTAVVKQLLDERNTLMKRVSAAAPANRADIVPEGAPKKEKTTVPQGGDFSEVQNPYRGN